MHRLLSLALMLLLAAGALYAERIAVGEEPDDLAVRLLESAGEEITLEYRIGAFERLPVEIGGETYYQIVLPGESNILEQGSPDLPHVCRSVIIPDDARMEVRVVQSEFEDIRSTPVAPSKGNFDRTIDPDDVPFVFGEAYGGSALFPSALTYAREPYILRDFRGLCVVVQPFQYDPVTQTLRVYTRLVVEVRAAGPGEVNVLTKHSRSRMNKEFARIYEDQFLNFAGLRYAPVGEAGQMLIITYDSFRSAVEPLAEWKNQMGVKTTIVDVSTIGNSDTNIQAYIQDFYDSTDLAYVLLVGDAAQVDYPTAAGGAADPTYALVAGSDHYPDLFVGRFSAENVSQVETQVLRSVEYEKLPDGSGAWYHKGMGVASNQGTGDDGEYDDEHMDNIRADLLAFTYTEVDQIYDPSGTAAQVSSGLNNGRSIINYCGHGSTTSWSSTGFSNTNINALVNDNMLPFIVSVACVNGAFTSTTCFAEAWLRATNGTEPTGAVGIYASSINQDWSPPMCAQDEAVDLMVAEEKRTFGGLCFNGSCQMMDEYGTSGENMFDTWHVFGDPSLRVRTDTPTSLSASHAGTIDQAATTFTVSVPGVEGALCGLSYNGAFHGSAFTDGGGTAVIPVVGTLPDNQDITVTVTAFNRTPYFGAVHVGPALYPTCDVDPLSFEITLEPDATQTEYLTIANNGDAGSVLAYSIDITDNGRGRSISGSTFLADLTEYDAGTTFDIVFTITCSSDDNEWIKYASLDFPSGVTVNSSTDFVVVTAPSKIMYSDDATGNGAEINWAGDGTYGEVYPGESAQATVNVTAAGIGDMVIDWTMDGDVWGDPPHSLSGSITLEQSGPSVLVQAPNGGEVWGIDEVHNIQWASSGDLGGSVRIDYSTDNGSSWIPVANPTDDDGLFPWTVPTPKSDECLVKISSLDLTVEDMSDAVFSIYQPVNWLVALPETGDVDAGSEDVVELEFNTAGMSDGDTYAMVTVYNNAGAPVEIPVTLHVVSSGVDPDSTTIAAKDSLTLAPDGGADSSLTITVTVRDEGGDPIAGIAAGDVVLYAATTPSGPTAAMTLCAGGGETATLYSAAPTNASGEAFFTLNEVGGCGTITFTAEVEGVAISSSDASLVRSPDFTGDGLVNFWDTFEYIPMLEATVGECGNLNWSADGIVNFWDTTVYLPFLSTAAACP